MNQDETFEDARQTNTRTTDDTGTSNPNATFPDYFSETGNELDDNHPTVGHEDNGNDDYQEPGNDTIRPQKPIYRTDDALEDEE
jgi:hypothetical protein